MSTLITEPAAGALIVIDASGGATLSEIARVTQKPVSTIQRAVEGLIRSGVLRRTAPRAAIRFATTAPRDSLRRLADWRLGAARVQEILDRIPPPEPSRRFRPPASVQDPAIRRAWPAAIEAIVSTFDPEAVLLFGSQARGDARSDSDVDLLVIFDVVEDRRERRVELRRLLNRQPFAKDVLVATRDEVERPATGSALAEALREGITVYAR